MATLTANGPQLLRITRESNVVTETHTWEKITRVYHANGVVLMKRQVRFTPDTLDPQGRLYTWGWKKVIAAKKNTKAVQHAQMVLAQIAAGTPGAAQWVVEFKAPQLEVA